MQRSRFHPLIFLAGALAVLGWSAQTAQAQTAPTATGLPAGFSAVTLGTKTKDAQSVTVDATGVWTIVAGGSGLGTTADGGMGVYTQHSGSGSIIAHLRTQADAKQQDAVVFRETIGQGGRVVRLTFSGANLLELSVRQSANAAPVAAGTGPGILGQNGRGNSFQPPAGRALGDGIWMGIDRVDTVFTFYWSNDGTIWNRLGGASQLDFLPDALVGIEASQGQTTSPQTSTLDSVTVSNDLIGPHALSGVAYTPQDSSVLLTWNPPADSGVTFNVYQYLLGNQRDARMIQSGIKTSSFLVNNLRNGQPYRFAVSAVLNGVETAPQAPEAGYNSSGSVGSTGFAVPSPQVPGGFSVAPGNFALFDVGTDFPGSFLVAGKELATASLHMKASGYDIYQSGDAGSFLAMPLAGDWDFSARFVRGPTNNGADGGWAQAGPMFRETLDPSSRFAMAVLSRSNGLEFKRRRVAYQVPTTTDLTRTDNTARPVTLRIVRKGDVFQVYYSEDDGKNWKDLANPNSAGLNATSKDTLAGFAKTPYVGLMVSGHAESAYTETDIDHIVIKAVQ